MFRKKREVKHEVICFGAINNVQCQWDKLIAVIDIPKKKTSVHCEIPQAFHQMIIANFFREVKNDQKIYVHFVASYNEAELASLYVSKELDDYSIVNCTLLRILSCEIQRYFDLTDICNIKIH